MKPKIVCWIPIDDKCNVLFDQIKPGEKEFTSEAERRPLPFPITDKVELHEVKDIELIKTKSNPKWCFWIVQGGSLVEK